LVKVKVHRGEPAFKKPTSKQTRLFQAKMLLRNGSTGYESSHGKSFAGKEIQ